MLGKTGKYKSRRYYAAVAVLLAMESLGVSSVFGSNINMIINGEYVKSSEKPIQQDGTTLVPLRVVADKLGASTGWNKASKKITVTKGDIKIELTIGSKKAVVNGKQEVLEVAPKIIGNVTMVPLRFISEKLNESVAWDSATHTVLINSDTSDLEKLPIGVNPVKVKAAYQSYVDTLKTQNARFKGAAVADLDGDGIDELIVFILEDDNTLVMNVYNYQEGYQIVCIGSKKCTSIGCNAGGDNYFSLMYDSKENYYVIKYVYDRMNSGCLILDTTYYGLRKGKLVEHISHEYYSTFWHYDDDEAEKRREEEEAFKDGKSISLNSYEQEIKKYTNEEKLLAIGYGDEAGVDYTNKGKKYF